MTRSLRLAAAVAAFGLLVAFTGSSVFAIFPQLQTRLSGPALNGRVPEGEARVDQSRLPLVPGQLEVRVRNVNLPDGTRLNVFLNTFLPVGALTLQRGESRGLFVLPSQVGRLDPILVKVGAITILSGGAPWRV